MTTIKEPKDQEVRSIPFCWAANKSIIIAGGGISGLSFAIAISKCWPTEESASKPKITILERDSESDRLGREGYTLSLRTDGPRGGGIQVLDDFGLYNKTMEASVLSYAGGGGFTMWDVDWNVLIKVDEEKVGNNSKRKLSGMRIRRNSLQALLTQAALETGAKIMWESEVVNAQHNKNDDTMQVTLAAGSTMFCDLLIAGDGSKSKIRAQLRPQDSLDFAGPVMNSGVARFQKREDIPKPFDKDWGLVLSSTGVGIFLAPVDERSALWAVSQMCKEPEQQLRHPMAEGKADEILEDAQKLAEFAGPKLQTLINATDKTTLMRINCLDRPPFRHTPEQHGPVVWIGDSNHSVSPFAGNGANMALLDGWDLGGCFLSSTSLQECLLSYDNLVIPRTQAVLTQSRRNIAVAHATGWTATMYWVVIKVLSFFFGKPRG